MAFNLRQRLAEISQQRRKPTSFGGFPKTPSNVAPQISQSPFSQVGPQSRPLIGPTRPTTQTSGQNAAAISKPATAIPTVSRPQTSAMQRATQQPQTIQPPVVPQAVRPPIQQPAPTFGLLLSTPTGMSLPEQMTAVSTLIKQTAQDSSPI